MHQLKASDSGGLREKAAPGSPDGGDGITEWPANGRDSQLSVHVEALLPLPICTLQSAESKLAQAASNQMGCRFISDVALEAVACRRCLVHAVVPLMTARLLEAISDLERMLEQLTKYCTLHLQ